MPNFKGYVSPPETEQGTTRSPANTLFFDPAQQRYSKETQQGFSGKYHGYVTRTKANNTDVDTPDRERPSNAELFTSASKGDAMNSGERAKTLDLRNKKNVRKATETSSKGRGIRAKGAKRAYRRP